MIGWREWIALPALGIDRIKAKIDTGARTSAIHAFNVRLFSEGGVTQVAFEIHPVQRRRRPVVACTAPLRDQRVVRSSNGASEKRYVIEVEASLGGSSWPIELTLADRDPMGFRMLLGREALRGRFVVDPMLSFVGRRHAGPGREVSPEGRREP